MIGFMMGSLMRALKFLWDPGPVVDQERYEQFVRDAKENRDWANVKVRESIESERSIRETTHLDHRRETFVDDIFPTEPQR